jgi:hydrogenase maturation protease
MVKIIALGNRLRGDDGIGPVVIEKLKKKNLEGEFTLLDAGSDAFAVLEHLIEDDPIIIIDCARMGKQPGEFVSMNMDSDKLRIAEKSISLHGFSLAEVIQLAQNTGDITQGRIIGIEPEAIEFNTGLSLVLQNKLNKITNFVIEEANHYGEKDLDH